MKRRDLLKLLPAVGVLPFLGGSDETPQTTEPPTQGSPDIYTMGSASVGSRYPSGTAILIGTGSPYIPGFKGWSVDIPSFGDENT